MRRKRVAEPAACPVAEYSGKPGASLTRVFVSISNILIVKLTFSAISRTRRLFEVRVFRWLRLGFRGSQRDRDDIESLSQSQNSCYHQ
jgi:hypothetical protein